MATCNTEYFVGKGKVYVAPRAANGAINGGWSELGDTSRLEINVSQDFLDVYESCSGNNQIAVHVPTQSTWEFAVDAKSFSKENLARAFYGTATAIASGSVTDEAVTAYALNQIIPLKHADVSTVVVQKGVTTLTAGTDYTVDAKNGTITLISATNLGGAAPWNLTVDYTYAAQEKIATGTTTIAEYAFRFEGKNIAAGGLPVIVNIHRVSLNMADTLSLIGDAEQTFTMAGMVLPDPEQVAGDSEFVTIVKAIA